MKRYNPKNAGNELEELFENMLISESIPYIRESTVTAQKKRTKGSVDFKITNPECYIECKRYTKSLALGISDNVRGIKWDQISFLSKKSKDGYKSGFVIQETHDLRLVFIAVDDLMRWWSNTTIKALTLNEALKIGNVVTDAKFILEVGNAKNN